MRKINKIEKLLRSAVIPAFLTVVPVSAEAVPQHGIAMHGAPGYSANYPHFNYVNPAAPKGSALRLAVLGSFDSLNPNIVKGTAAAGMREYVYESLLSRSLDEPFSLYGLLAESVDTPDNRQWAAFRLRDTARFSDGAPVTPEDVIFSWDLLRRKGRPNHRNAYSKVTRCEKTGDREVTFTFGPGLDREMPLIMGLMPILPRHATAPETFEATSLSPPVGSGPYVAAEVAPGSRIVYKRNPAYWGQGLPVTAGLYNFDTISFDYYRDSVSMLEAFRKGLFDVLGTPDPIDPVTWAEGLDFPAARNGTVQKRAFDLAVPAGMNALVFNTRRTVFADKRVREALKLVFDFDWLNRTMLRGLYERTQSFFERSELSSVAKQAAGKELEILQAFSRAANTGVLEGTFREHRTDGTGANREGRRQAFALLASAGYELKNGAMTSAASGEPLSVELLCGSRDQERLMIAYASALRQIGIAARIRLVDPAQYQRRLTSFDFDMIQMAWQVSLSPGNEQNFRWSREAARQEGSFNYAGVESPAADAAIEAMLAAKTRDDFVAAVRALDRVLISGAYVIPLFFAPQQWIAAWNWIGQPQASTLYGSRVETWWSERATGRETQHQDGTGRHE